MDRIDTKQILADVRANLARISGCKRHRFPARTVRKLGERFTCLECGGVLGLTDIGKYIEGYEAAGGACDDIWPGYRAPLTPSAGIGRREG